MNINKIVEQITGMDIYMVADRMLKPAFCLLVVSAIVYFVLKILIIIIKAVYERRESRKLNRHMKRLVDESFVVGAEEFLKCVDEYENYVGVYVIFNRTQDMYYVGQATRTVDRLKNHLTGHGNGDVYADFKYGDEMYISVIPYDLSQGSLNDMEANYIDYFDACEHGYNKTKGNHH